jgi:transmembrane sensor
MSRTPDTSPSLSADAEATRWLARLRGPERDAALEKKFNAWLAADEAHRAAFACANDIWHDLGGAGRAFRAERRSHRLRLIAASVALVAAVGLAASAFVLNRSETESFRTAHGEQRSVVLSDGTRVALNTDSRIEVEYRRRLRQVRLTRGEALFEVAANPRAPFIVNAMGRNVRALGTAFLVDRHAADLAVTLIHGAVRIAPDAERGGRSGEAVDLRPGQRWDLASGRVQVLAPQRLDSLTAWQKGQVTFDHTPIVQAVAEMNRYSRVPIVYRGPTGADATLSGVYHTQDSRAFARTIAALESLTIVETSTEIALNPVGRQP